MYYKVVRKENGILLSARTDSTDIGRKPVQYIPNQWVSAYENTRLFVFDNLIEAKRFANNRYNEEIWECKIIGGIKGYGCAMGQFKTFWDKVNSFSNKKKKVDFTKIMARMNLVNTPAILVKKVKLTKRVA